MIPKDIRDKTIFLWLQGVSRDDVARIVGIGAGTASEIVKNYRSNDTDAVKEREYAVNVRKQGYNIRQLEPAIRLKNRIEMLNWREEQVETLFDRIEEHCFKEEKEVEVFIKEFEEFLENRPISQKLQTSEESLARVTKEKDEVIPYLNRVNNMLGDI
jgi:transposase